MTSLMSSGRSNDPGAEITVVDDINMEPKPHLILLRDRIDTLEDLVQEFAEVINEVPKIRVAETSLGKGNPELTITVNRDKAAHYGIYASIPNSP